MSNDDTGATLNGDVRKMWTVTLIAETVCVICSECKTAICEPSTGSEMWTAEDLYRYYNQKIACQGCGRFTRFPAKKPAHVRLA